MYHFESILNRIFGGHTIGSSNESFRVSWLETKLREIPPSFRILDAGAGEQQFKKFCSHLDYVSQDFAQYNPNDLKSGLQVSKWNYGKLDIVSDIASIPEPAASFDAIMCTEVFEHVINPREAIVEFSRLLKPKGTLIITAPFCSLTHFAPYHFYTGFNRYFYQTELKKSGFEIVEITENGNFFEFLGQELNRLPYIGNSYAGGGIRKTEIIALRIVRSMLQRFSRQNKKSEELLCFGLQVLAKKI